MVFQESGSHDDMYPVYCQDPGCVFRSPSFCNGRSISCWLPPCIQWSLCILLVVQYSVLHTCCCSLIWFSKFFLEQIPESPPFIWWSQTTIASAAKVICKMEIYRFLRHTYFRNRNAYSPIFRPNSRLIFPHPLHILDKYFNLQWASVIYVIINIVMVLRMQQMVNALVVMVLKIVITSLYHVPTSLFSRIFYV